MSLDDALEKAGRQFDAVAASHLVNTEEILRHRGASSEEIDLELARVKAQHAEDRRRMLATVIAIFYCWRPDGEIWASREQCGAGGASNAWTSNLRRLIIRLLPTSEMI